MAASGKFSARTNELNKLDSFVSQHGSGLTYVRGRRRVGKTWLLKEYQRENPKKSFYFMGAKDSSDLMLRKDFAIRWAEFSGDHSLVELSETYLTWPRVFRTCGEFFAKNNNDIFVLMFDEIQWIAKRNSGVISALKEIWVDWEKRGNVKVIICGSSNRFFVQEVLGHENILRGLRTSATIWVPEFTLKEVEDYYLQGWRRSEICLAYMMLGGSPYYLQRLEAEKGFVHALNDAIFIRETIFLEEVDEVLNLEFNAQGLKTAKKILLALGQTGTTKDLISKKTGIPLSTVSEAVDRLVDFEIVFEKHPINMPIAGKSRGLFYVMRDFFLNFYFQILMPFENIIKANEKELLLTSKVITSNNNYYIQNFSGKAFELLCERVLRSRPLGHRLLSTLMLRDTAYRVGTFWSSESEIDIVVENDSDRISRLIECKWVCDLSNLKKYLQEITAKKYNAPNNFSGRNFLLVGTDLITNQQRDEAEKANVKIVTLNDLF